MPKKKRFKPKSSKFSSDLVPVDGSLTRSGKRFSAVPSSMASESGQHHGFSVHNIVSGSSSILSEISTDRLLPAAATMRVSGSSHVNPMSSLISDIENGVRVSNVVCCDKGEHSITNLLVSSLNEGSWTDVNVGIDNVFSDGILEANSAETRQCDTSTVVLDKSVQLGSNGGCEFVGLATSPHAQLNSDTFGLVNLLAVNDGLLPDVCVVNENIPSSTPRSDGLECSQGVYANETLKPAPCFGISGSAHVTPGSPQVLFTSQPAHLPADVIAPICPGASRMPCNWKSLFKVLPKNAGSYTPTSFKTVTLDGVSIPPPEVVQEGVNYWSDFLVGFFLDSAPSYKEVRDHCKNVWKPRGSLRVQYLNSMFYFKFSNVQDKLRALETSPLIIDGQPFIITPWNLDVDKAREQVLSIPVWATFTHIPSVLQPLIGLNWLASLIGDLKCFDSNTEARRNLLYARALIEISPTKLLPSKLKVRLSEGTEVEVDVQYKWKPDICISCQSFGHTADKCASRSASVPPVKIPLPNPELKWVPKVKIVTTPVPIVVPEVVPAPPPEDDIIYWEPYERAWVHTDSEMRYDPALHSYHMFVGEDGETRRLIYNVEGEGLALSTTGEAGQHNWMLFLDATWDRSYLYSPLSRSFDPKLAISFSDVLHVIGSGTDADVSNDRGD